MAEVRADKSLGQHFLSDGRVIADMVAAITPHEGDHIIEIGPGLGALTLSVLKECKAMSAIELDSRVLAILQKKADKLGNLSLINANVLDVNFTDLLPAPLRIIGNLPYNLSSPILFHCLTQRESIVDMHFMLQKEVVERIAAKAGSKIYGRLSIMSQLYSEPEILFNIPPSCFDPPPKVDSAVIRLVPRKKMAWDIVDIATFDEVVRLAFSQRRKMLRKSLGQWFQETDWQALEIDPTLRPEMLDGDGFSRIANCLYYKRRQ